MNSRKKMITINSLYRKYAIIIPYFNTIFTRINLYIFIKCKPCCTAATIGPPGILPVSQATTDPENTLGTIIT